MSRRQHGLAWPGFNRLANLTCLHRSTIKCAIKALEQAGHVTVARSRLGSKNNPNEYRPMLKVPVQNEPTLGSQMNPPRSTDEPTPRFTDEPRTSEDNLRENRRDNLYPNKAAQSAADRNTEVRNTQIKRVAEEKREATLTSSDNPLSPSQRITE
jgi:hypothetical protein